MEERKSTRELLELQNRVQELERALMERSSVRASSRSLESQRAVGEEGELMTSCSKCGGAVHFHCHKRAFQSGTGKSAVDDFCPP